MMTHLKRLGIGLLYILGAGLFCLLLMAAVIFPFGTYLLGGLLVLVLAYSIGLVYEEERQNQRVFGAFSVTRLRPKDRAD